LIALLCVMAQLLLHRPLTPGAPSWPAVNIRIKQQAAPLETAASCLERMTKSKLPQLKVHPILAALKPRSTYSL
jgi:hypothetical protein